MIWEWGGEQGISSSAIICNIYARQRHALCQETNVAIIDNCMEFILARSAVAFLLHLIMKTYYLLVIILLN